ncbi:glycogen-binding domain-containing protein [Methylobacterium sp. 17Sr1-1]|uniref:glycogen-binding domain-containing protein n=1 Tax=Methylobacterium sp. 17Sr1-1 TaxID=2202826 RepID=UPI0013A584ED|nr:glycogen-binding domain-containing protein [Methylobacterium sp. 17Sr1-1]
MTDFLSTLKDVENAVPEEAIFATQIRQIRLILPYEAQEIERVCAANSYGGFVNHWHIALRRLGDNSLRDAFLSCRGDFGQDGWISMEGVYGASKIKQALRFHMPAERSAHAIDDYGAGPMGSAFAFHVDLENMRVKGESIDYYSLRDNDVWPSRYRWRTWDIRTGSLLDEQSHSNRDEVPYFGDARPDCFRKGTNLALSQSSHLTCINGSRKMSHEVAKKLVPQYVEPIRLMNIDGQLAILGYDDNGNLYRVDVAADHADTNQGDDIRFVDFPALEFVRWFSLSCRYEYSIRTGGIFISNLQSNEFDVKCKEDKSRIFSKAKVTQKALNGSSYENTEFKHLATGEKELSPKGGLAILRSRTTVAVWDHMTGRCVGLCKLDNHWGLIRFIIVSPNDKHVLAITGSNEFLVWNLEEFRGPVVRVGPQPPHWRLSNIIIDDPVRQATFLFGGALVAVITEQNELLVVKFWQASSICARLGLDERTDFIFAAGCGDSIFCLGASGRLSHYRFSYICWENVTYMSGNRLIVRLLCPGARTVELAGSFTDWRRVNLRQNDNGVWCGEYCLPYGFHEYKFVVDEKKWITDPHNATIPGPFSENSYVVASEGFYDTDPVRGRGWVMPGIAGQLVGRILIHQGQKSGFAVEPG